MTKCTGCGCEYHRCVPLIRTQRKCCPDCSHVLVYPTNLEPWDLEPHYSKHVMAMTAEGLERKAEIAEQLAYRDCMIDALLEAAILVDPAERSGEVNALIERLKNR